ncbi:hypothetical protein CHLRE_15g635350v5 [Chlamydomonas reinhardtii]|uniref:type I protein arginine methyltransferase n=1 Tax=Chlamydomonas reinhardtii TaxID=3055 RepID=A0A2K3CWE7_CHLRE|nr:uncharacterized protein CHLRE_15g635350v5 [Chlamydomonas reinhardtii]PNW72598.1 hypothetical protein CHLRE_15g635350v5 [Chlamydomonas reinhardtii]
MTGGVQTFSDLRVALVHPDTGAIAWDAAHGGCKLTIRSGFQGAPQLTLEQANGGSIMQCILSARAAWRAGPTLFFLSPLPGGAGGALYAVQCCSSSNNSSGSGSSSHGDSGSSSSGGGRAAADQLQAALDAALATAAAAVAAAAAMDDGNHACGGGGAGGAGGRRNLHAAAAAGGTNGTAGAAAAAAAEGLAAAGEGAGPGPGPPQPPAAVRARSPYHAPHADGAGGRPGAAGSKRAAADLSPLATAGGASGGAATAAAKSGGGGNANAFDAKTDRASSDMYFHYYGQLQHQQNMLQDYTRTGTYYSAIVGNPADFAGRVVMDVGAGSGILSLFAAQAGAARVYAVEASGAARWAAALAAANPAVGGVIKVLNKRVDVLVSEPMGTLLLNERMIESYLHARDRFLKPGGKMFPCLGRIHAAAFSDALLHAEVGAKAAFWQQPAFYGVDLTALHRPAVEGYFGQGMWHVKSPLHRPAVEGYFGQVVVDAFDPGILVTDVASLALDFGSMPESDLLKVDLPLKLTIQPAAAAAAVASHAAAAAAAAAAVVGTAAAAADGGAAAAAAAAAASMVGAAAPPGMVAIHGLACWFDVFFAGSQLPVWLTTAPGMPTTHWFQLRCVLPTPLLVPLPPTTTAASAPPAGMAAHTGSAHPHPHPPLPPPPAAPVVLSGRLRMGWG